MFLQCGVEIGVSGGTDLSCMCDLDFDNDLQACFACIMNAANAAGATGEAQAESLLGGLQDGYFIFFRPLCTPFFLVA